MAGVITEEMAERLKVALDDAELNEKIDRLATCETGRINTGAQILLQSDFEAVFLALRNAELHQALDLTTAAKDKDVAEGVVRVDFKKGQRQAELVTGDLTTLMVDFGEEVTSRCKDAGMQPLQVGGIAKGAYR